MDTKWKSIKRFLSFALFFLGVSLTLWNLPGVLRNASGMTFGSGEKPWEDYQQSRSFRRYISERLENFLSVAVNGFPAWNYYSYNDGVYFGAGSILYPEWWFEEQALQAEETSVLQAETDTGVYEELETDMSEAEREWYWEHGLDPNYGWGDSEDWEERLTEEEKERIRKRKEAMTRAFFDGIAEDKNLLYSVSYDGELLYSNGELQVTGGKVQAPEGYNFLLYFDGEKVSITKDGQETDVYGDGYYREADRQWYVPGYRNFPVSDEMKKAVICIAAAKEPVKYTVGPTNRENGYREQGNDLYWIQYNLLAERERLRWSAVWLGLGLVLLILSCFCRKSGREAAERLAAFQGKIWVECKILLIGAVIFGALCIFMENGRIYGGWDDYYWAVREGGLTAAAEYGKYLLSESALLYLPGFFWILLFWTIYLVWNDLRHNKKGWRRGLISRCREAFSAKELKLPLVRRMVHRNAFLFGTMGLLGLLLLAMTAWVMSYVDVWQYEEVLPVFAVCILFFAGALFMVWRIARKNAATAREVEALTERISEICSGDYSERGGDGTSENRGYFSGRIGGTSEDAGKSGAGGSGKSEDSGSLDGKDSGTGGASRKPSGSGEGLETAMSQLENIRQGMAGAVDEQMKSERMKVELIANVSHDLKTPLTSIISYVQFLKDEEGLPEHVKDYVRILDDKSQRLNQMVQDVFAVSKAASGELPMNMEELDFGKLLRQTLADMDEEIQGSRVSFRTELPEKPVMITADGQRMYRVFQNLFQNALKYSLDGSRVYVALRTEGGLAAASVKNTSHMELDEDQSFTERFFRGDKSRTDGGSGLGLSIAQSFTEACGGQFELKFNADLFIVEVSFVCEG
ncbi:MAG: HAMP domain-containing histidine kinase [Roseburia sp.]|nr:HAMP domain-containing histidine kinase [Roseburia sp.]MCM1098226.1 HAMP domain-containing histidine kinase [Ruminococcus flavefaciens]